MLSHAIGLAKRIFWGATASRATAPAPSEGSQRELALRMSRSEADERDGMTESVVIVSPRGAASQMLARIPRKFRLSHLRDDVTRLDAAEGQAFLVVDDAARDGGHEADWVREIFGDCVVHVLEFRDAELGRELLAALVDDDAVKVEDEHGVFVPGRERARRLRQPSEPFLRIAG